MWQLSSSMVPLQNVLRINESIIHFHDGKVKLIKLQRCLCLIKQNRTKSNVEAATSYLALSSHVAMFFISRAVPANCKLVTLNNSSYIT